MKRIFTTLSLTFIIVLANGQICPDNNHPHAIDLGLPSGTKWACCNVDTDYPQKQSPTHFGGYYAWGETETKSIYDWNNYIHCDGSMGTSHDIGSDIAGSEHDVAHVHWGDSWTIPSQGQVQELVSQCTFARTTENGVEGGLFTSPNGHKVFLPAADIRWNDFLECPFLGGYYWSSTKSPYSDDAYCLSVDLMWGGVCGGHNRGHGLTVRPVKCETSSITHQRTFFTDGCHAIYNTYGIEVRKNQSGIIALPPGIYIVNGKKVVLGTPKL